MVCVLCPNVGIVYLWAFSAQIIHVLLFVYMARRIGGERFRRLLALARAAVGESESALSFNVTNRKAYKFRESC